MKLHHINRDVPVSTRTDGSPVLVTCYEAWTTWGRRPTEAGRLNQTEQDLRATMLRTLCVDHGHAAQEGGMKCRTCPRRVAALLDGPVAAALGEAARPGQELRERVARALYEHDGGQTPWADARGRGSARSTCLSPMPRSTPCGRRQTGRTRCSALPVAQPSAPAWPTTWRSERSTSNDGAGRVAGMGFRRLQRAQDGRGGGYGYPWTPQDGTGRLRAI